MILKIGTQWEYHGVTGDRQGGDKWRAGHFQAWETRENVKKSYFHAFAGTNAPGSPCTGGGKRN